MDLNKFKDAFEKMDYDARKSSKPSLNGLYSTVIVTESSDLDSASDFISSSLASEDLYSIKAILVQESVSKKFLKLLEGKVKNSSNDSEVKQLSSKGFEVIGGRIVKCPLNLISNPKSTVIALDVFRTSKEAISLAKSAQSVNLWCNNVSITFEFINALNAFQIFLNSSHGISNSKIPFFVDGIIIGEELNGKTGSLIEVTANIQFQTTFQGDKFKTVVIPFGETFAN